LRKQNREGDWKWLEREREWKGKETKGREREKGDGNLEGEFASLALG